MIFSLEMSELYRKLRTYADSDSLPMHMPGHKRRMGEIGNPFFIDITEIDGFDNLHHARGILMEAQKRAAELYGSEETHYLVNGSTAGILAAVSGCTSCGGEILIARNSHKSVYHGALLKGLHTGYIYPQSTGEMGINGVILPEDVESALKAHPDTQAVVITSPTYDGVVSRVDQIASVVHAYGIPLIVDEAHGAHFPFSDGFPEDSVCCGADVVIHSLHKTLPSLTQTALIHLNGPLIDREKIRKYLTIYQSSSPSYVLMAGMDQCMDWVAQNREEFDRFAERLERLRKALGQMKVLKLLELPGMDRSKILVSSVEAGISGQELSGIMRTDYHIELEMACSSYVCAITTVADTDRELGRLGDAFLELDERLASGEKKEYGRLLCDGVLPARAVCTMQQAEERKKEDVPLPDAEGQVSGDFVMLYPPGIPLLTPGEEISREIRDRIEQYQRDGFEVQGAEDGFVRILKRN